MTSGMVLRRCSTMARLTSSWLKPVQAQIGLTFGASE